jgi:restriction system protein
MYNSDYQKWREAKRKELRKEGRQVSEQDLDYSVFCAELDQADFESELRSERAASFETMTGTDFEYYCAKLLLFNGFERVSTTSITGDQGVDLVAEKEGLKFAIQCKCYNDTLGNTPVQEVYLGKAIYDCDVAVVMTNSTFTKGAKEAAEKVNVKLWDIHVISEMRDAVPNQVWESKSVIGEESRKRFL